MKIKSRFTFLFVAISFIIALTVVVAFLNRNYITLIRSTNPSDSNLISISTPEPAQVQITTNPDGSKKYMQVTSSLTASFSSKTSGSLFSWQEYFYYTLTMAIQKLSFDILKGVRDNCIPIVLLFLAILNVPRILASVRKPFARVV